MCRILKTQFTFRLYAADGRRLGSTKSDYGTWFLENQKRIAELQTLSLISLRICEQ
jgi:hypothetical protein